MCKMSLVALCFAIAGSSGPLQGAEAKPASPAPALVEVHFTDGSIVRLQLLEEKLPLTTPYGKLSVPVAAIRQIDFASRFPDEVARKVDAAIARLGSKEFKDRGQAASDLLQLGAAAYQALQVAAASQDMEVSRKARQLLGKIKVTVPADRLVGRPSDMVTTHDSRITGKIEATVLKARTTQFGEVQMKLADVRSLHIAGLKPPQAKLPALADPGSLTDYTSKFGTRVAFTVTGNVNGSLWGSDVYTLDSTLATAAVHAGVLKNGQTGVVNVEIIMPPASFDASTRNGVTSFPWGAYPSGAFRFTK